MQVVGTMSAQCNVCRTGTAVPPLCTYCRSRRIGERRELRSTLSRLWACHRRLRGKPLSEPAPPAVLQPICIIGVKKQEGPPPITIATAEEYRAYFGTEPPPHWFAPVVTVIPIPDAPEPLWPPPYPEQLEPGAVLIEDAIDRSDWRKP